jgi:hypothetical protein
MSSASALVFALVTTGICCGCATVHEAPPSGTIATSLGFDGCIASGPFSQTQVVARDKRNDNQLALPHSDWDALISAIQPGDRIYFVDCRTVDAHKIVVGASLYVLERQGTTVARALEVIYD